MPDVCVADFNGCSLGTFPAGHGRTVRKLKEELAVRIGRSPGSLQLLQGTNVLADQEWLANLESAALTLVCLTTGAGLFSKVWDQLGSLQSQIGSVDENMQGIQLRWHSQPELLGELDRTANLVENASLRSNVDDSVLITVKWFGRRSLLGIFTMDTDDRIMDLKAMISGRYGFQSACLTLLKGRRGLQDTVRICDLLEGVSQDLALTLHKRRLTEGSGGFATVWRHLNYFEGDFAISKPKLEADEISQDLQAAFSDEPAEIIVPVVSLSGSLIGRFSLAFGATVRTLKNLIATSINEPAYTLRILSGDNVLDDDSELRLDSSLLEVPLTLLRDAVVTRRGSFSKVWDALSGLDRQLCSLGGQC